MTLKKVNLAIVSLLFLGLSVPTVFSHVGESANDKEYQITVQLNEIGISKDPNIFTDNDQNFFGDADVLFHYTIDPTNPKHDETRGLTNKPISVGSGGKVVFDGPIEIYSHTTCSCDQEINTNVRVLDYTPVKSTVWGLFKKGVSLGGSYLTAGPVGMGINLLGEAISWVTEQVIVTNLSDEEQKAYAAAQVITNSNYLGTMDKTESSSCGTKVPQLRGSITNEEREVGYLLYSIQAVETGKVCPAPKGEISDGSTTGERDESGDAECDLSTGKVKIDNQFVCPISSIPAGASCQCREGYEWADPNNKCDGCTKTRDDRCLEAVRRTVADAAGVDRPSLSIEDKKIIWDAKEVSCKAMPAVMNDFTVGIRQNITKHTEQCTSLRYLTVESYNGCSLKFYFQYKN
ncbi:MAG: hypothetical protein Q7S04_01525 [Candidatus Moranbacteria bacterium]|nr:hypothetical protein [Candidatus Moranbacteria bacterium]